MNNANYFFYIYTYIPGWPFIVMYSFLSPYGCCAPCVCVVFCLCPALRVFVSLASRARWLLRWMDASLLLPTPVTGWGGFVAYAAPQAFFIFFFLFRFLCFACLSLQIAHSLSLLRIVMPCPSSSQIDPLEPILAVEGKVCSRSLLFPIYGHSGQVF